MKEHIMSIPMVKNANIGLVIMASGLGKRFGGNKLMEPLINKPLVKWIIDTTEGVFYKRVVVTRSSDIKTLCDSLDVECIVHDLPSRNDTIRLGLNALMKEVDYCFFATGDQPLISRESILRLIDEVRKYDDIIVRTGFGNEVGSPVGFPKKYFAELLNLPEGKGGNLIAKNNPEFVHQVEVYKEYELWDVDTTTDLDRIKSVLCRR